jgi:hypothetical protein
VTKSTARAGAIRYGRGRGVDISGGLAIAILAVIALRDPAHVAANMTGSNPSAARPGLAYCRARRPGRGHETRRQITLESGYRVELGFLAIASVVAFLIPPPGQISLVLRFALLGFFVFHPWKASRGDVEEPHLVGPAATIGALPETDPEGSWWSGVFFSSVGGVGGPRPLTTLRAERAGSRGGGNNDRRDSRA